MQLLIRFILSCSIIAFKSTSLISFSAINNSPKFLAGFALKFLSILSINLSISTTLKRYASGGTKEDFLLFKLFLSSSSLFLASAND